MIQFSDPQTDVNGQSVLMTTSLITANKHVQTSDEVDSDPTMELQPFEEALLVESSIPFPKSNIRPWIIDCLLAGALFASLVLLFYLGGELKMTIIIKNIVSFVNIHSIEFLITVIMLTKFHP